MSFIKRVKEDEEDDYAELIETELEKLLPKFTELVRKGIGDTSFRGLTVTRKSSKETLITLRVTMLAKNAEGLADYNHPDSGNFVVFTGGQDILSALAKLESALKWERAVLFDDKFEPLSKKPLKKRSI